MLRAGLPVMLYLRQDAMGPEASPRLCEVEGVRRVNGGSRRTAFETLPARLRQRRMISSWVGALAEVWAPPLYAVGARGSPLGLIMSGRNGRLPIHAALRRGQTTQRPKPV